MIELLRQTAAWVGYLGRPDVLLQVMGLLLGLAA